MNLSFAGCGFLGLYHMGVVSCLKNYAPQMFKNKVSGVSAGAIAACSLFVDLNEHIGEIASDILRVCIEARQAALGPFSPSFDPNRYFYESLNKILPDDIHLKVRRYKTGNWGGSRALLENPGCQSNEEEEEDEEQSSKGYPVSFGKKLVFLN
eukprot:GFUD01050329.1.p1 GENE.GFUD01050329.1~~GFUD01050329.1.p1  ORF type:complete len:153 (+),score=34.82 GFUD01050329.1:123-581(+)